MHGCEGLHSDVVVKIRSQRDKIRNHDAALCFDQSCLRQVPQADRISTRRGVEGTHRDLYQNIRTYKCRSAGARYRIDMPKKVRAATLGTAAAAVWFAVVTLGFGAQLWRLFEGVR
jgi:hypothetical protein